LIEISDEERKRIDGQNWTASDGVALPVYLPQGRGFRLAHNPDGSCVFLDKQGLCRIHAKFGETAKPLACQIYPYAFHPGGKKIVVSLRFSCPSVVANRGTSLSRQISTIAALAGRVVPAGAEKIPAPLIDQAPGPSWPDFFRFLRRLDQIMAQPGAPVARRVLIALKWLELIEEAGTATLAGPDLDDVLAALAVSASDKSAAE
jgi:lysine-N-methylase